MRINELSYVALVSRDVGRTASLFGETLKLARTDVSAGTGKVPAFSVGQTAIALFEPGHPFVDGEEKSGVHHFAFAVDDPERASSFVCGRGFRRSADAIRAGLQDKPRAGIDASSTAGVKVFFQQALDIRRSPPGPIERIDHLGIASADNRDAIGVFCDKLGLALESQQTDIETQLAIESFTSDKYGAIYHTRAPQIVGGLRVAFVTAGDCELEFLQNFDPSQGGHVDRGSSGTTRQDQGAITRYITSRGAGLHHLAFKTEDINGTLAILNDSGFVTIDKVGRPGSRRALIGFVQPKSLGGVLIHFVQRGEHP